MDTLILLQLFNIVLLIGWPILSIFAIFDLRRRGIAGTTQALWVLIILFVPFLGALAFWLVQPKQSDGDFGRKRSPMAPRVDETPK